MLTSSTDALNLIAGRSRRAEGEACQAPRRLAEERVRARAATCWMQLTGRGWSGSRAASQLHLSRRTLTRWRRRPCRSGGFLARGRPRKESSFTQRRAVLELLDKEGTHLGLPTLRSEFSHMPRCELTELQVAYRQHFRATHRRSVEQLTWHGPGRVWATDHVVPPNPINGVDRATLAVRDLASGAQLAWRPVPDQTAAPTIAAFRTLFTRYGPPLVVKSDNGPAFRSEAFAQMLAEQDITWLPSPARMPWYNGGCEAGNGSLRRRTDHFAQRTGGWTSEALEAARRQANTLTRPQGHLGPTPNDRWSDRASISPEQRTQFHAAVQRHQEAIIAEWKDDFQPENKNHQRQVHRQAVRQALLELGLLTTTRRSISLPLKRKKRDKIS